MAGYLDAAGFAAPVEVASAVGRSALVAERRPG
jgi:hypothetical protein